MNNRNIIFYLLLVVLISASCIKDTSTWPDKEISEITVTNEIDTLNIDFGYELVLEAETQQTMSDLELTYEWAYQGFVKAGTGAIVADALQVVSDEKVLRYSFKNLGEYLIRLKVSNIHGSTFKYFRLFVNAPFNQGIFVLSADENKKGRVSFMRPLSREEEDAGKTESFYTSAFATVNPQFELNDPTDVEKIGPDIFILSRKDKLVYRIDSKTFDLFNVTDFKDLPWMSPLAIFSKDRSITNYIVLSETGEFGNVNYNSDIAFKGSNYFENNEVKNKIYKKITGEPKPPSTRVTNIRAHHFMLNYEESKLYFIYDLGYPKEEEFLDQNLINVVMGVNTMSCLVSRSKTNPENVVITRGYANSRGGMNDAWVYTYPAGEITLTRESVMQSNNTHNSVFYTNGNKLYRWYNWIAEPVLPTTPVVNLEVGKEITSFEFSQDGLELYLGVYDPSLSGLKGSVYIYDADAIDPSTGQLRLKKKFEGVADKPIKVFWKNSRR